MSRREGLGFATSSNLQEVLANNDCVAEMGTSRIHPHLVSDGWILRGHEMGKDQGLDARPLRQTTGGQFPALGVGERPFSVPDHVMPPLSRFSRPSPLALSTRSVTPHPSLHWCRSMTMPTRSPNE